MGEKSVFEAYLLAVTPLGFFGGVHFYLGRPHIGLLYMCTVGVFGVGVIVDLFRLPTLVREANTRRMHKKDPTVDLPKEKSVIDAYLMWFPLGLLGLHHVYLKNPNWALLYAMTGGLFVVGWVVDAVWMVSMVNTLNTRLADPLEKQKKMERREEKKRIKKAKKEGTVEMDPTDIIANKDTKSIVGAETMRSTPRQDGTEDRQGVKQGDKLMKREKETRAAIALGLSPLGILGAHHWYLRRSNWGIMYLMSAGLGGIGWILDWFRLVLLLRRCNAVANGEADKKEKTVDDAYVLWFPWGILGVHQFYLGRHGWGFIYLMTAGIFGVGWLSDAVRIPQLVRESNQRRVESKKDGQLDIDTNITPPRDDYDTSLTLNLGDDNEAGSGLDTRRSRMSQQEQQQQQQVFEKRPPPTEPAVEAAAGVQYR